MKILHWNILADKSADTSPYGFPHVDPAVLAWEFRQPRIVQILKDENPDLVSLVEVDRITDLRRELKDKYECILFSQCTERSGQAIFVRKEFTRLRVPKLFPQCFSLPGNRSLLMVQFDFESGRQLVFATTHLKAKPEFSKMRVQQVGAMLRILDPIPLPQVVCGDFNDVPTSDCMKEMLRTFRLTIPEDTVSTCKKREVLVMRRIDYILTRGVKLSGRIPAFDTLEIPEVGLPSKNFPSDHLYLTAQTLESSGGVSE